jgi:hypothetical protein
MAQSPEELKRDIEQTRRELTQDVDALNEKVSPAKIVSRRVDKTRDSVSQLKERVMGTASSGTSAVSDKAGAATSGMSSAASSVSNAVSGAPGTARQQAQGNPFAAGLLAFAGGWLLSRVLPASKPPRHCRRGRPTWPSRPSRWRWT